MRVHFVLQLNWIDLRPAIGISKELLVPSHLIWTPTVYLSNELQPTPQTMPDSTVVTARSGGHFSLRRLISADLSCPVQLATFPLDVQNCPIVITGWGLPESRMRLQWGNTSVAAGAFEGVPNVYITHFDTANCSDQATPYGQFSCVRVDVTTKRMFGPYLLNVYIPLTMCVLVSFTTFWSRVPSVRAIISMVSLLLAAYFCHSTSAMAPSTDYTKFIDIFTGTALTFIVATLLEFHTVMYVHGKEGRRDDKEDLTDGREPRHGVAVVPSNAMDRFARAVFPLLYLIFVVVYWILGATLNGIDA